MLRRTSTIILILFTSLVQGQIQLPAELDLTSTFGAYDGAMVIRELESGALSRHNPVLCAERHSPCSTYKIPHSLIALQTGVLKDENHLIPWDGIERSIAAWNKDLTLTEAIQVSSVPYFKKVAATIGVPRMQTWLDSLQYGNQDISGGLTNFWLGSSLTISCEEQVQFLTRMITYDLPFSRMNIDRIKAIICQGKTDHGIWYGKTGGCVRDGKQVHGWFVGYIMNNDHTYIFATFVRAGENPNGREARRICESALKEIGLW